MLEQPHNPLIRYDDSWLAPSPHKSDAQMDELRNSSDFVEEQWESWKEKELEPLEVLYAIYDRIHQLRAHRPELYLDDKQGDVVSAFLYQSADWFGIEAEVSLGVRRSVREYVKNKAQAGLS